MPRKKRLGMVGERVGKGGKEINREKKRVIRTEVKERGKRREREQRED